MNRKARWQTYKGTMSKKKKIIKISIGLGKLSEEVTCDFVTIYNTVYQEIACVWREALIGVPDIAEMRISKMEFERSRKEISSARLNVDYKCVREQLDCLHLHEMT